MTNSFHGAILLLSKTPDEDTATLIANDVAKLHFPGSGYNYELTTSLPENTPRDTVYEYTEMIGNLPDGVYLVVNPDSHANNNA